MKRRAGAMLSILFIVFVGLIIRIGVLSVDEKVKSVGHQQGARSIVVAEVRGTIYDRNLTPLVNRSNAYYATLLPSERLLQRLISVTDASEYERLQMALRDQVPLLAKLNGPAAITDGLRIYMAPTRYEDPCLAPHLLGYLNGSSTIGVAGIEKAFDAVLRSYTGSITATYPVNGRGEYIAGDALMIENSIYRSAGGVVLTIDSEIQKAVETTIASMLDKGAVVVLDATNGKTLSIASCPSFHPATLPENIKRTDGALLNRALCLYDSGSVFKIVTAIAALESGIPVEQVYECPGAITVGGHVFHCHQRLGHQTLTMNTAFAQSCNVYFIQLAQQIGAETLLKTANKLGLTEEIVLGDTLTAPASTLPTDEDLSAAAALANLSFGQGCLLISPLHIARMTAAITGNGILPAISVVQGVVNEKGHWIEHSNRKGERALSVEAATALRHMMELTVTDGTGRHAKPENYTAAGKTGTAETGQVNANNEVVHSWFTGYYPADKPRYVITVLVEDMLPNSHTAAEIFCEISNNL